MDGTGTQTCWVRTTLGEGSGSGATGRDDGVGEKQDRALDSRCGDKSGRGGAHMASLMPRRMSQIFAGHAMANPMIMPICIRNQ